MNSSLQTLLKLLAIALLCTKVISQQSGEVICENDEECGPYGTCSEDMDMCLCVDRWGGIYCNESLYCDQNNPCYGNGDCTTSDEEGREFICECNDGFDGIECSLEICPEEYVSSPSNTNTSFPASSQRQTAASSEKCDVGFFAGKPIGSRKCGQGSKWEEAVWISDCDADLNSMNDDDQIAAMQVLTSDPTIVKEDDVKQVIDRYSTLAGKARSDKNVSLLMSTLNNLLQVNQAWIESEIPSFRLDLTKMGRGVDLKVLGDLQVYENVETVIAMSVVWDNSSSMLRETQTQDYAISLPQTLQKDDGLKGAQFDYSTEENALQTAALYARTSSENRMIFQLFVDESLFPRDETEPRVESPIIWTESFSIYQLKFYLFEFYPNLNDLGNDTSSNRIFVCGTWSNNAWRDSADSCTLNSAANSDIYNYFTCNCTKSGYHAILSKVEVSSIPETPQGLSGGEIAGIVIGSIAGVALILGGVGYAVQRSKKKSETKVIPMTPTKKNSLSSHENHYVTESRRSSSDAGKL